MLRGVTCARVRAGAALSWRSAHTMTCFAYCTLPDLKMPAALPKLPYGNDNGIPPVLSPRQLELHYAKHHKAYVDKLNLLVTDKAGTTIEELMCQLHAQPESKTAFNQAAQHFNHTFYWNCLTPGGCAAIPQELQAALTAAFGSVEKFKEEFALAGVNNFGSGWTWLCVCPKSRGLKIVNTSNAGCPITDGLRPIFTADVWEHAYYKDYENRRPDYLKEVWGIVNWEYVAETYAKALQGD